MSDVPEWVVYAIVRLRPTFSSAINKPKSGIATGFVVDCDGWFALVTNRHVVEPSLRSPSSDWRLTRLEVQVRQAVGESHKSEVQFVELDLERSKFAASPDADVVAIGMSVAPLLDPIWTTGGIHADNIADESFLSERTKLMDFASFVGFASSKTAPWWDEVWNTPIARFASLASLPSRPFTNKAIKTADVGLVSGLSFSGSSGSPLFLHAKGQLGTTIGDASYQPPKLIGIMSGHHWELDQSPEPELLRHSGLSYYTRATSVHDVLRRLGEMRGQ
jgi:hypothetical protein